MCTDCNVFVAGLTVDNLVKGAFYKPRSGGRRKWKPGTQALWEVHNLMRTTNLCILKAPFLWLVQYVKHVGHVSIHKYSTYTPVYCLCC